MSEQLSGLVESVKLEGPFLIKKGKNEGKEFHTHKLVVSGKELSQTDFRKEPKAPASKGDNVNVLFTTSGNGKFVNNYISELRVLGSSELKKEISTPLMTSPPKTVTYDAKVVSVVSKPLNNQVSKDTSMEVSGLLQALVSTGGYVNKKHNPETGFDNTFIEDKLLELHLRRLLTLKRKIALELEINGVV